MNPQGTCDVAAARTAKALTMVERARWALYREDIRGAEIELSAALAELPLIALYTQEQSGTLAPARSRIQHALSMVGRSVWLLYRGDTHGAEIELTAALAELPLIALYLKESNSS